MQYPQSPIHAQGKGFVFPNSQVKQLPCIKAAFAEHGMEVADVQHELFMWTYVLTDTDQIWLHDRSHGGGGYFTLYQA